MTTEIETWLSDSRVGARTNRLARYDFLLVFNIKTSSLQTEQQTVIPGKKKLQEQSNSAKYPMIRLRYATRG